MPQHQPNLIGMMPPRQPTAPFSGNFQSAATAPPAGIGGFQPQQAPAYAGPTTTAQAPTVSMAIPANVLPDGAASMIGNLDLTSSAPPPGPPGGTASASGAGKPSSGTLDIG